MERLILKDVSKENVEKVLKKYELEKDEYFEIIERVSPKKLLFFTVKGEYEVLIRKKGEKVETEKEVKEVKEVKKEKVQSPIKEEKVVEKESFEKKPEYNEEKTKIIEKIVKEHFELAKLDIKIVNKRLMDRRFVYYLEGSDLEKFSKEKGLVNLGKMISYALPKLRKRVEFVSLEEERRIEQKTRKLARNVAKKVISTKGEKDLFGLDSSKRRLVHDELSSFKNIKTESFGEGKKRYIKISYIEK